MKKICLIIAMILCFGMLFTFTGCADTSTKVVTFYDFESYERNLLQVRPFAKFGVISANTDQAFVTEGEASCKLQPLGELGNSCKPYVVFPTYSGAESSCTFNFMDFTQYKSFVGDFFNAENEPVEMEIGLATSLPTYEVDYQFIDTGVYELVTLKPGWNRVVYTIEHELLSVTDDITNIYGVYIAFENANSLWTKDAKTIYVDNFKLEKLETPYTVTNTYDFDLDSDTTNGVYEIASFDKAYQRYLVWCEQLRHRYARPDLELINPNLGTEIDSVLKVYTRNTVDTVDGVARNNHSPIFISGELVKQHDIAFMKADTANKYYMCADVYNNSDVDWNITMYLTTADNGNIVAVTNTVKVGKWLTFKLDMTKVKTFNPGEETERTVSYLDDTGNVKFFWDRYETGARREFWIDNVRIEKVANA